MAVCAVCALVPVLNSAFYALNSSYYARWYYMPTLILAAMTVNALEDPTVDLDTPARGIGWLMLATLVFAVVPVRDDTTETWSLGVLKTRGSSLPCWALVCWGCGCTATSASGGGRTAALCSA